MDNKQAIEHLKRISIYNNLAHWEDNALDKAITSLEAWDKVVEEINELIQGDNGVEHIQVGEKRALNIIEKYKKEIEE